METSKENEGGCDLGAKFGPNEAQCCEKSKETGIINKFFHISHGEYLLKQKLVVLQTPQWKFKADVARIVTSEEPLGPNFCPV